MASDKSNALAELAERVGRIRTPPTFYISSTAYCRAVDDIKAASRIIAELAKVVECKHPDKFMPLEKPYEDITVFSPVFNGFYEQNCFEEDESRFILDLANAAWNCREIAEEGANDER